MFCLVWGGETLEILNILPCYSKCKKILYKNRTMSVCLQLVIVMDQPYQIKYLQYNIMNTLTRVKYLSLLD